MENLFIAIKNGDEVDVRRLIHSYRRNVDDDGIVAYAYLENKSMLKVLHECGVDLDERDTGENTIIMSAAAQGDIETLNWLIDNGVDINAVNQNGETAFSYACAWDQLEVARVLFERGANPNPLIGADSTPLDDTESSDRIRSFLKSIGAKRREDLHED